MLKTVLERLRGHGLTARPSKCNIGFNEVTYLGFKVGDNKISPVPDKVSATVNYPPPTTKKMLRSFLGMISFYSKFVPNLANITSTLSDLLKNGVREPLPWTELQQEHFQQLKEKLINPI